jgi:hypothetical protein
LVLVTGFLDGNLKANNIKEADQVFKDNTSEIIGFVTLSEQPSNRPFLPNKGLKGPLNAVFKQ